MRRAFLNLRFTVPERRRVFTAGLKRLGYEVVDGCTHDPRDGDIFVSWSRIHDGDYAARIFEQRGLPIIVAENCSFGSNRFAGRDWYHLARTYHNVAGTFPVGDNARWDSLGIELEPFRTWGETVVLASRGIGPAAYRMPAGWPQRQQGRVRAHPGRGVAQPLRDDLGDCGKVICWGSAAAVQALMWGISVESHQPNWIAEQDNTESGRLAMFRRLAHAQFTLDEIESGEPFARLLEFNHRKG